jgi:Mor family transcriptional regulator
MHNTNQTTKTDKPEPVTAGTIAREIGRSTYGVKKAIRRLKIEPVHVLGGMSFYDPKIQSILEESMRSPNTSL